MQQAAIDCSSIQALLQDILLELSKEHSKAAARHEAVIKLFGERSQLAYFENVTKYGQITPEKNRVELVPAIAANASSSCPSEIQIISQQSTGMDRRISEESARSRKSSSLKKLDIFKTRSISDVTKINGWFSRAAFIVNHDSFESVVAVLIVVNALVLGLEIQHEGLQVGHILQYDGYNREADQIWPMAKEIFPIADWIFGIMFFVEMLIKVSVTHRTYFLNFWNLVDFVCVAAFVIDKLAARLIPVKPQYIRLLRLFRLLRLVRLIHRLENLEILYTMTTAIRGTFSILIWSVFLLTTILITCALFLAQGLHATYFSRLATEQLSEAERQGHTEMFEYFGTFTRCLFSMFELALANWPPIARILTEEVSEWFQLVCVIHKIIIGLAVVGVINGVVLKETFKVADTDDTIMVRAKARDKKRIKEKMTKFFAALDFDQSGEIDIDEFLEIAANEHVQLWLNSLEIETDDLVALFHLIDKNQSGSICLEEVTSRLPRLKGPARCIDVVSMCAHITTQWERLNKHVSRQNTPQSSSSWQTGATASEDGDGYLTM